MFSLLTTLSGRRKTENLWSPAVSEMGSIAPDFKLTHHQHFQIHLTPSTPRV
jgi:hypothetical protein